MHGANLHLSFRMCKKQVFLLRTSRMRWFGHVERSTGWIAGIHKLNVVAQSRSGRPRKSWDEAIKNERKKLDMRFWMGVPKIANR